MTNIKRGEVYMADLEVVDGSVQHGYRPVVCANLIIGQLAHRKVGQYQYN